MIEVHIAMQAYLLALELYHRESSGPTATLLVEAQDRLEAAVRGETVRSLKRGHTHVLQRSLERVTT